METGGGKVLLEITEQKRIKYTDDTGLFHYFVPSHHLFVTRGKRHKTEARLLQGEKLILSNYRKTILHGYSQVRDRTDVHSLEDPMSKKHVKNTRKYKKYNFPKCLNTKYQKKRCQGICNTDLTSPS